MRTYKVYWSFNFNANKKNSAKIIVNAWNIDQAKSAASRIIDNPLAYIITVEEYNT